MVRILISFLLSFSAFAANVPQASNMLLVGGPVVSSTASQNPVTGPACYLPTNSVPIVIFGGAANNTANNRLGFYKQGSQYQVTNGKTFVSCGMWLATGGSSSYYVGFGYNASTFTNNSSPSGDTYYGAGSTAGDGGLYIPSSATSMSAWIPYPVTFPSQSYPFIRHSVNANNIEFYLIGFEI